MTLREKQSKFAKMVQILFVYAHYLGYEITFGEAWRSKEEAKRVGFSKSLHTKKLAIDINLFKDGKFLSATKDHKMLGEFWEFLGGTWGGRFSDGNHYSLKHKGVS